MTAVGALAAFSELAAVRAVVGPEEERAAYVREVDRTAAAGARADVFGRYILRMRRGQEQDRFREE